MLQSEAGQTSINLNEMQITIFIFSDICANHYLQASYINTWISRLARWIYTFRGAQDYDMHSLPNVIPDKIKSDRNIFFICEFQFPIHLLLNFYLSSESAISYWALKSRLGQERKLRARGAITIIRKTSQLRLVPQWKVHLSSVEPAGIQKHSEWPPGCISSLWNDRKK